MAILLNNGSQLQMQLYGDQIGYEMEEDGHDGESYDNLFGKTKEGRNSKKGKSDRREKRRSVMAEKARQVTMPRYPAPRPLERKPAHPATMGPGKTLEKLPLAGKQGAAHKAVNKALQEEFRTKQEEVRTKGLEKKVEQEDLKAEKLKAQTGLARNAQYIVWFVVIAGVAYVGWDAYMKYHAKQG